MQLRDYQERGVNLIRKRMGAGIRRLLYVLPTGGGKTAVFSYTAQKAVQKSKRVFILVHRHELLMQASASLEKFSVGHGLLSPRFPQTLSSVQIASVPTLTRRLEKIEAPDLIIVDEAHHATARTYTEIVEAFPKAFILGVTATPCRSDGRGLEEVFDEMILGPSIRELTEMRYLVPSDVFAPPIGIDLSGVHRRMGDYDKTELATRIDKSKITGDCVDHYLRLCSGQPAIAFCVSVIHAEHVAEAFRSRGIRARRVDGAMDDSARRDAIAGLGTGELDVLTSADLIGEGVDIPRVGAAILLRPTQSLALFLQQVGRALRPHPGKEKAIILDHVGNCMRHGMPDDDRLWSLEGAPESGPREMREGPLVRIEQCEKCFYVYESGPDHCPGCGRYQESKARKIEVAEGELEKLEREKVAAARNKRHEEGQAQTYEELLAIEQARGYKSGWAKHRYQSRRRKAG